jgi:hypothetical protein
VGVLVFCFAASATSVVMVVLTCVDLDWSPARSHYEPALEI